MSNTGLWTFPADSVLVNPHTLSRGELDNQQLPDSFLRAVRVAPPNFSFCSLETLLARTDGQLERVAKMIGGRVVDHDWGFIDSDYNHEYIGYHHWFGHGFYGLVARVNRIEPADYVPAEIKKTVTKGIIRFKNSAYHRRKIDDMGIDQVTYGYDVNDPQKTILPYLHDIEPVYQATHGLL